MRPRPRVIVTATTPARLPVLRERLDRSDLEIVDVAAPTSDRCVVSARGRDPWLETEAVRELRSEDWMTVSRPDNGAALGAWEAQNGVRNLPGGLSVCPAWSAGSRDPATTIELGPGGFGNGDHPTTCLIIELLVARVGGGESVLDVGCGSGILALCALRLGAASAHGIDIDPDAVAAFSRNAALNGAGERASASPGPLDRVGGRFGLVLANIARAGIVELAASLVDHVADGGELVVSGVSPRQVEQVADFLVPLHEVDRRVSGEWAAAVFRC